MKYKHKKTEKIATKTEAGREFYAINGESVVPAWMIENSSDWEKIEERDYIVTEYYAGKGADNSKAKLVEGGKYQMYWANGEGAFKPVNESSLTVESWQIYSVKRLSDGQEFKIGDKMTNKVAMANGTSPIEIHSIILMHGKIELKHIRPFVSSYQLLSEAILYVEPKVLYTTEDGVKRYEFGTYEYWIQKHPSQKEWTHWCSLNVTKYHLQGARPLCSPTSPYRIFSTKEAAEAYIEKNNPKKLFTTSDGKDIYEGEYYYFTQDKYSRGFPGVILSGSNGSGNIGGVVYFSTEQLAQKYIDDNNKFLLTEDGVKAKLGDKVFSLCIYKDGFSSIAPYDVMPYTLSHENPRKTYLETGSLFFSTKEKGEEYVANNSKKYSLADIEKAVLKTFVDYKPEVYFHQLKKELNG